MPRRDDETIELAARAIAEANEKHLQRERLEIALLIVLFVGGLGLLIAVRWPSAGSSWFLAACCSS